MMHSRSLGGGRRLALLGAIVVIVGCLLPWYTVGGDGGLPPEVYRAFTYPQGLVVFLAGLGTLALVALPYAMGPRPVALDRGLVFGVLAVASRRGRDPLDLGRAAGAAGAAADGRLRLLDLRHRVDHALPGSLRDLAGACPPLGADGAGAVAGGPGDRAAVGAPAIASPTARASGSGRPHLQAQVARVPARRRGQPDHVPARGPRRPPAARSAPAATTARRARRAQPAPGDRRRPRSRRRPPAGTASPWR